MALKGISYNWKGRDGLLLLWKSFSSEETRVHEDIALTHRTRINDYSKNHGMEGYQTIKSSRVLYYLEMYLEEDKTRQRRCQVNFKRKNIKENIMF